MSVSIRCCPARSGNQFGFTLIEQLVAVTVLSIGLLGVAGLQVKSLQNNDSAYYRSQAAFYSYEILDRMRANRQAAVSGDYNLSLSQLGDLSAPSGGAPVAQIDRYDWLRNLDAAVPGAKAALSCDTGAVCLVTVQWDDSRTDSANPTKQHVLAARI